ncbi:AAA family ATPase [Futiania mangrovi]|uniref:AAA family ATPase n=1 Tax=Futiania mangrovi TaxID=2959716 RepID=A0A9J6PAQ8_9PROT|nr:AAA family ATPase [Futiania mangrovii]MCP1335158.1 AAA family ATPase [Futiania mangrovii]
MRDLARHMEAVARHLLGEPNARLSSKTELRYGTHGSLSVDLKKGTYYDNEAGKGGGVLHLIGRETGHRNGAAFDWLRNELGIEIGETEQQSRIVAEYDYRAADGDLLFQVVRFEPKAFLQRRPAGGGGWIWNLKGIDLVPYRLPQILEGGDRTIYIAEGEKDVHALEGLGLLATCNPGGAGKWREGFSQYLAGADVVILPDNDEAGRDHAEKVAASLRGKAARVRIVHLPGLQEKGDAADWIAAGGTAEELDRLAEAEAEAEGPRVRFQLLTIDRLGLSTAPDYTMKGMLPREGMAVFWGHHSTGKSFLQLDMAMSIARGAEWRGHRVRQGAVVYIAGEGQHGFRRRIEAYRRMRMAHDETAPPFYLMPEPLDLIDAHGQLIADIRAQGVTPAVVVLDTLNRTLRGSENKPEDMAAYIAASDAIRDTFGCLVSIVHHCGVDGDRPRGHTSLSAAADAIFAVKDHGKVKALTAEKQKDGPIGEAMHFRLDEVDLGEDDEGDPISSCVVEHVETQAETFTGPKLTRNQDTMLMILDGAGPGGLSTEEWNGRARIAGLAAKRAADLWDLRNALKDKSLVYCSGDLWHVRRD